MINISIVSIFTLCNDILIIGAYSLYHAMRHESIVGYCHAMYYLSIQSAYNAVHHRWIRVIFV